MTKCGGSKFSGDLLRVAASSRRYGSYLRLYRRPVMITPQKRKINNKGCAVKSNHRGAIFVSQPILSIAFPGTRSGETAEESVSATCITRATFQNPSLEILGSDRHQIMFATFCIPAAKFILWGNPSLQLLHVYGHVFYDSLKVRKSRS